MEQDLEKITKSIQKKLDKDSASKISDDIASIITIKANYEKQNKANEEEILKLKEDKEVLIQANGNLLQQVSMANEEVLNPKKEKEEKKESAKNFDFSKMFDEKGNFIK